MVGKNKRKKRERNTTIAIGGIKPRCGSTHISLLYAIALKQCGFRVALVNMSSDRNQLHMLCSRNVFEPVKDNRNLISYGGVDIYSNCSKEELIDVYQDEYDYIVMDYGSLLQRINYEYMRADLRIIVALAGPLDYVDFFEFWKEHKTDFNKGDYCVCFNLCGSKLARKLRRTLKIKAIGIGMEADYLNMSDSCRELFQSVAS